MDFYAKLVAFAPLVSFAIVGGLNRMLPKGVSAWTACAGVFVSFLAAVMVFSHIWTNEEPHVVLVYDWITSGTFDSQFSFLIDRLSATFILMITGVSFLIHVFSVGYMWEDDGIRRFFAYLNLFVFFMLILILADNFLVTFIGWEGVGFCSFMLISFWYKDMKNNDAAKKAFVMNRIGDFGFLMAMCLMVLHLGTLNYPEILSAEGLSTLQQVPGGILSLIALCLLLGAAGKSAQIPLYTWLPDAMAAPTPVSALIHAATMVTVGVYLVARTHVFFEASPEVSIVVAWVGVATALLGAIIGVMQTDIKKVLAYSTVSQLGLMFLALGVGAYSAAIFHVVTHAFFKALLFLGSGSVIHAMSGEQDIRRMGGLKKHLPVTYSTFLIGTIAISGIPPLAGFFSKDEILAPVLHNNMVLFILGIIVSLLTAFYMFRLFFLTFSGEFRGTHEQYHHLHESPKTMTIPLIALAILSICGGWIGLPHMLQDVVGYHGSISNFLAPALGAHENVIGVAEGLTLIVVTTSMYLGMIWFAHLQYVKKQVRPVPDIAQLEGAQRLVAGKFFVDEFYRKYIVQANDKFSEFLERVVENKIIDAFVNRLGLATVALGNRVRKVQTGYMEHYVIVFILSVVAMLALIIL